ncbi:MAG: preprotein translocase subunit YajC [Actinobacteria bacterium]|nr:preprotein translocase subunit YajC [Actinomycetota bacterium]
MLFLASDTAQKGNPLVTFLMVGVFFAFYWFYMRPRNKKRREQMTQSRNFEVGDEIQTIGGLIATVVSIIDDKINVRTSSGVELAFVKRAISGRYNPPVVDAAPEAETKGQ